jgi:HAE1 family hydrophobic/amphiphilic exporter-1
VAQIALTGGREREIQVNIHKSKMDALKLSIPTVAGILAAQTANIPGGHVTGDTREYTVRVQGEFTSVDEIACMRIPAMRGGDEGGGGGGKGGGGGGGVDWVPLSAIADVMDTYKEVRENARYNRENTVGLSIIKRTDANTVQVAQKVRKTLAQLEQTLPPGMKIHTAQDRADFIEGQVSDMYQNIFIGIILTALMLFIFLGDWRLALIAATTIPGSVVITFLGMQIAGFTLNMITLMSIGISVGTLVSNAIIVLENIARHRNEGMEVARAAEHGTNEVVVAVLASSLTNVAVFVPIANTSGITGQFFTPLGVTITVATLASLFLSFTLVPMMASRILRAHRKRDRVALADRLLKPFQNGYIAMLQLVLRLKALTILAVLALLVFSLYIAKTQLGTDFFPQTDSGFLNIDVEMPAGTAFAATDRVMARIEERLFSVPEVERVYASVGGTGSQSGVNYGALTITLKNQAKRTRTTNQVANAIRPLLADLPDVKAVVKQAGMFGGGGSESDIQVEVTGDKMADILALAEQVRRQALTVPGLVDVKLSWEAAKPEIKFIPDRLRLDEYGVQVGLVGFMLRNALSGYEAAVFREENDEYTIRVQLADGDRNTIDAIENISVPTQKGMVPLKNLAAVRYEGGANTVQRKNRQRLITVNANVSEGSSGAKVAELQKLTGKLSVPFGYKINYGGMQEMMEESFSALGTAAFLAIIITYMVLAGSIESLIIPVLIMLTLPLGLVGVIWALFFSGHSISMISLMSLIMLIGVVVNNAILLVDYANQKRQEGMNGHDAIVEACRTKFVAIVMMNLAIILSSLPAALATGTINAPFAITAIGGIIISTLMTYFVIPVFYVVAARK